MNDNIKVSVIVPVYNAEKYLEKCLLSLKAQTLQDIEVICIDDCSTDKSREYLNRLAEDDQRIKVFANEHNLGVSRTRNRGLEIARGDFIGFVDADDYVSVDFFANLWERAEKENADIAYGSHALLWKNRERFHYQNEAVYENHADMIKLLKNGGCCDKIFKKELLLENNIKFMADVVYEDNLFVIESLLKASKMVGCSSGLYFYIIHENSLTQDKNKQEKKQKDSLDVAEKLLALSVDDEVGEAIGKFVFDNSITQSYLLNKIYYRKCLEMFKNENMIKKLKKLRQKIWRKWLFNISIHKKEIVICGFNCWRK